MPGRQFREEEIAHASSVRRQPQEVYRGLQLQIVRPQARKLSQATDRAELLRVNFISSAKFVALRHSPKVLILGVERKDWE